MRRQKRQIIISICLCLVLMEGCRHGSAGERPSQWGEPLTLEGVPNFHRLDDGVYRSAQPRRIGFKQLEKSGFRSIICLRKGIFNDLDAQKETLLHVHYVPMASLGGGIRDEDVLEALKLMTSPAEQPCLVHCLHGADRTGIICAAYRMVVQGWSKEEALREMREGGYGHHRHWPFFANYIRQLDVDALRRRFNEPRN